MAKDGDEHPGSSFVALRAASLRVDDLCRRVLRAWVMDALDFRGDVIAGYPPLIEPGAIAIAAGIMTLYAAGRALYRKWLSKWTDHTGRLITPAEHARRLEEIRASRPRVG